MEEDGPEGADHQDSEVADRSEEDLVIDREVPIEVEATELQAQQQRVLQLSHLHLLDINNQVSLMHKGDHQCSKPED